jgi:4-amino-4-deoxy-L-arabinose transferase-like glycosyltransferase
MPSVNDRRIAAGLFFLVLGVYLITYVGAFKSNDERAYFSGMDSFVKRGDFTANQIYWDYTAVGVLTTGGDMVPNYEPGQMIAPIPLYLWGRALGASVQGVLFFNAIVLAGAAALLYLCLIELAYGRRAALLGALVFAFATLAWPYSRTFFREPLTTFAYLLAFYALLRYRPPAARRWIWPALAGFGLGLAIVTKLISVGAIPGLALLAWGAEWRRGPDEGRRLWPSRLRMALAAALPLIALLALYQLYTWMTLSGVETFGRNIVEYTTNPQLSQTVPMRMLRALAGITISPYKGLFWFSPVLLLGLVGAWPFIRRHRWEGLAALLIVVAHIVGYSRYNYWSGGVAWGMRYLLPITPFLVLLAAPVWEFLMGSGGASSPARAAGRIAAWALIAVSLLIAVLGVSVDLLAWEVKWLLDNIPLWGGLGQAIEGLMLRPEHSPVLGHLRLLLSGQPLDFAWVQRRPEGATAVVWSGLLVSLGLAAASFSAFVAIWRKPERAARLSALMTALFVAGASVLLLLYRQGDARFDKYDVNRFLQPMIADLAHARCERAGLGQTCADVFLMPDPALTDYFLNFLHAPLPWYSLEARPVDEALGERLAARYGQIWLGRDRNASADDQEGRREWERWLTDHAHKLDETRYEDWARLVRFSAAGAAAETARPGQTLGEFTLPEAALRIEGADRVPQPLDDGIAQARPGDILQVALTWRAERKPEANYTVFLQLLDEGSQVVAQSDRWPGDGLHPTADMAAGQTIVDRVALRLPERPGRYRLIAGMYRGDVEGAPRLDGPDGDFAQLADIIVE